MLFHDYKFENSFYKEMWQCVLEHTYDNMKLYYRKQLSMRKVLSTFRKVFHIAPITLKQQDDKYYKQKLLAIYLLTKYSNETYEFIASEFKISKTIFSVIVNSFGIFVV